MPHSQGHYGKHALNWFCSANTISWCPKIINIRTPNLTKKMGWMGNHVKKILHQCHGHLCWLPGGTEWKVMATTRQRWGNKTDNGSSERVYMDNKSCCRGIFLEEAALKSHGVKLKKLYSFVFGRDFIHPSNRNSSMHRSLHYCKTPSHYC